MNKKNYWKINQLLPVIVQDDNDNQVLMLGYTNNDAFAKTLATGFIFLWSRKRKKIWMKGEISGNRLQVVRIYLDCDKDAILIRAKLIGKSVCHTGNKTCFYKKII